MKKILCNKKLIIFLVNLILLVAYVFLIPLTYELIFKKISDVKITYIVILLYILLYVLFHIILYEKLARKIGVYICMNDNSIIYNNQISIPKIMITKIIYKKINIDEKKLEFYLCDDTIETIYISKSVAKEIAKKFHLNVKYDKEARKKYKKEKRRKNKLEIIQFIHSNKYPIIFCIIGLILTILSFILHYKINSMIIKSLICVLCISCGWSQLYFLYVKKVDDDKITRSIISVIASIVILVVMCILLMLLLNDMNKEINVDCVFYAIYLFPSFIIIGLLILLIMSGM